MSISNFQREYGGVVWTDHALERLNKRKIAQSDALAVLRNPDKTFPGKKDDSVKFIRTLNGREVHVVGVLNEYKKWIILSLWVRGEEDRVPIPERWVYAFVDWVAAQLKKLFSR